MASLKECHRCLTKLVARLADIDEDLRRKHAVERTLSCQVTDLDATFYGLITADGLAELTDGHEDEAQIRLAVTSDDLVALCDGDLTFTSAWTRGRIRVDASMFDLLRMRNLF
jgi:putative sterol carrier protein